MSTIKDLSKIITAIILSIAAIIMLLPTLTVHAETYEKQYCTATIDDYFSDNEIIIVVMPFSNFNEYTISSFSNINCVDLQELSSEITPGELSRIIKLTLANNSKQEVLNAIKVLETRSDIYSAEPNYIGQIDSTSPDTYFESDQDNLRKISIPQAWAIELPDSTSKIKVGIIDSGIQSTHPDLANRINTTLSKSFLASSSNPFEDKIGHGTMIAGIIGAEINNGIGISGIAPNVELVSLRIVNQTSIFNCSYLIEAIEYASSSATYIPILNCSAGSLYDQISYSDIRSLRIALQGYQGLFVCSAGNSSKNVDIYKHYPSDFNNLPNVISVGATRINDQLLTYSNYGTIKVDLFAPGESIMSTYPTTLDVIGYRYDTGTSLSAAHVSGVAAFMLSVNTNLLPSQIKDIIIRTVDEVSDLENCCVSGGRLNAYKAVYTSLKLAGDDPINYTTNTSTSHTVSYNDCGECIDCADTNNRENCSGCEACGDSCWVTFTELHNFVESIVEDENHVLYCLDCGYSLTANHTLYTKAIDEETETVTVGCRWCSLEYVCQGYIYTSINSTHHTLSCNIDCAYQLTEEHFFSYSLYNSSYHTASCQHCSESHNEVHKYVTINGVRQCADCGHESEN